MVKPSRIAIGISAAEGPLPRTITSSIPSFRWRKGSRLDVTLSHCGAPSSGKNDPDRNAIGSTKMFASDVAPSTVFDTDPASNPSDMNANVPQSTNGTAMYQEPVSCNPKTA